MPAVFPLFYEPISAKCFLRGHHFLSKIALIRDIFLNQLIQFYSNNATNVHHLTKHSMTVLLHKMAIVLQPQICDVISPYALCGNLHFRTSISCRLRESARRAAKVKSGHVTITTPIWPADMSLFS